MTSKTRAYSLIVLAFALVLGAASLRMSAQAAANKSQADTRVLLNMPPKDKALMMDRMRGALGLVQGLLINAGNGNWKDVAGLAHLLSNQGVREDMKNFSGPPPMPFLKMAQPLHDLFDQIEKDAMTKKDAAHTTAQVAQALGYCSACHAAFKFNP